MDDSKFDPGAAKYGNFINYYQFNSPENRISLLPLNFLQLTGLDKLDTILCLDIGCNTGELTQALYNSITKALNESTNKKQDLFMVGVDIDSILIERANELNDNKNITYLCANVMNEDFESCLNIYLDQYNKQRFDMTFAFSITMWIHLNNGDSGVKLFLMNLSMYSDCLVIEPQPWKCYKSAVRRMKRCNGEQFSNFDKLQIRKDVELEINNIIMNVCHFSKLYETVETKWGRKISIYKKYDSIHMK